MSIRKDVFVWKQQHKLALLREVLILGPYVHKVGSRERGNSWSIIADNLNKSECGFKVSSRSVREKFAKLYDDRLKKERYEATASGIEGSVEDEFETALSDIHGGG